MKWDEFRWISILDFHVICQLQLSTSDELRWNGMKCDTCKPALKVLFLKLSSFCIIKKGTKNRFTICWRLEQTYSPQTAGL